MAEDGRKSAVLPVCFTDIEAARARIRDSVYQSPCALSATLSRALDARVYLKLENLQMTGSFKERGAMNKLVTLSPAERAAGVVAASAGNHAQGVAYHAQRLGIDAVIVMPEYTPLIKVSSTRRYGAAVRLEGIGWDDAQAVARQIAADEGRTLIHPFDDAAIIAGQGTIGLELLEQNPYLDAVVVPIGGGGLIAGIAVAIKETNPRIKVYGVEAAAMPGMKESVAAGHPVTVPAARTLADGIAVGRVGDIPHAIVSRYVDDIVTVDDEEIASAILTLLEVEKAVVEAAGAAPLAAIANGRLPIEGRKVALLCSGGNIDVTVLSRIIERGLVKDGRMVRMWATIADSPGSLARFAEILARQRGNVIEIGHDRAFMRSPLGTTRVTVTMETRGHEHIEDIISALTEAGIEVHLP